MILTLYVLPVLYWLFFRNEKDEEENDKTKENNANA